MKFKVLPPEDVSNFLADLGPMDEDEFCKAVLEYLVFNMKTEIRESLKMMSTEAAKSTIEAIYNGCIMLNPGLDLDFWVAMAYAQKSSTKKVEDLPMLEIASPLPSRNAKPKAAASNKRKKLSNAKFVNLGEFLNARVVGQTEAVGMVCNALKRSQAGLADEKRPLGVFLFAGASGVGKSSLAKELHTYMYGEEVKILRIDCGEFQHKHENQKLLGCFVPESPVLMADNLYKNIEDVQIGDTVYSHLGLKQKVVDTHAYRSIEPLVRIKAAGLASAITCTPQHEFFSIQSPHGTTETPKNNRHHFAEAAKAINLDWHAAKTLQKGDWLAIPRPVVNPVARTFDLADYIPLIGGGTRYKTTETDIYAYSNKRVNRYIQVDEKLARLAGYYVSEGGSSKTKKTFSFTFHIKERSYGEEVIQLVKDVFGIETHTYEDRSERNSFRLTFHSRVVSNFLSVLFGDHTHRKRIPKDFLEAPETVRYALVETAFLGDGCLVVENRLDYSTVSRDLHSGMLTILRSLGIDPYYALETKDEFSAEQARYRIYVSGSQLTQMNANTSDLFNAKDQFSTRAIRGIRSDCDYTYHRVESVSSVNYDGWVHDLSVENDISYCVNGVAVHNSPPGYIGFEEGGQLTNGIMKTPNTVVLLDEIEKAHPDMWHTFLRIFDEGMATDGKGKTADFRNAIIVMTTNLGNDKIVDAMTAKSTGFNARIERQLLTKAMPVRSSVERATHEEIRKMFKPEFLNRIDSVIVFNHLRPEDFAQIADLEMRVLDDKLSKKGIAFSWTDSVVEALIDQGVDTTMGARGMAQVRREQIETQLADAILGLRSTRGVAFDLSYDGKFNLDIRRPKQSAAKKV